MKLTNKDGATQSVGVRVTDKSLRVMTVEEFTAAARAQGATRNEDIVFVCPACGTLQSGQDLITAGAGKTFEDVAELVGFSCIGRWKSGTGCKCRLGGPLQVHALEIITEDGEQCPRFDLATPEQAKAHLARAAGGEKAA